MSAGVLLRWLTIPLTSVLVVVYLSAHDRLEAMNVGGSCSHVCLLCDVAPEEM